MNHYFPIQGNASSSNSEPAGANILNAPSVANLSSTTNTPPATAVSTNTAAQNNTNNNNNIWENDVLENDDFDSDQLDEDESYSWASGITDNQDGMPGGNSAVVNVGLSSGGGLNACGNNSTANWRDWRSSNFLAASMMSSAAAYVKPPPTSLSSMPRAQNIPKLVDLCAKYVAINVPFELVESFRLPVPEDLQLKITFSSFPDSVENIRLYSCLANGHVDEYLRGEQLYNNRCVRKIIQIGFHLSAQVDFFSFSLFVFIRLQTSKLMAKNGKNMFLF